MKKNERHSIYFTMLDLKALNQLAHQRKESKSAVVRKLVHTEKYSNVLTQIEQNNAILAEFLKELHRIGININQVVYHLNIGILSDSETKVSIENQVQKFQNLMEKFTQQIDKAEIAIGTKHKKAKNNSNAEYKGEESE